MYLKHKDLAWLLLNKSSKRRGRKLCRNNILRHNSGNGSSSNTQLKIIHKYGEQKDSCKITNTCIWNNYQTLGRLVPKMKKLSRLTVNCFKREKKVNGQNDKRRSYRSWNKIRREGINPGKRSPTNYIAIAIAIVLKDSSKTIFLPVPNIGVPKSPLPHSFLQYQNRFLSFFTCEHIDLIHYPITGPDTIRNQTDWYAKFIFISESDQLGFP